MVFTHEDVKMGKVKFQMGDIWLGEGDNTRDRMIRYITRSPWNHAAVIIDKKGTTIELTVSRGIRKTKLIYEKEKRYFIIRLMLNPNERRHVAEYARKMLRQKTSYDFLGLICLFTNLVLRLPLILKVNGAMTCSEFVADALTHGGIIWDKDPALITPKDLYDKFVKYGNTM